MLLRQVFFSVVLSPFVIASTAAFFFQSPRPAKSNPLLSELDDLIKESNHGLSPDRQDAVKDLMVTISKSRDGDQRLSLPGEWELIFTTEKEINFFKTSWPFAKVSSISQTVDPYQRCIVNNFIRFEGGGEFAVTGSVVTAEGDGEYDRVEFEFTSAVIRAWGQDLRIPPVGSGWFDTMYCDEKYRFSRDSRGDWSVFRRL